MTVAVAIVAYRNAGDVLRCLQALEHSSHADFEVIICENGGEGAYAELTAALPSRLAGGQTVRAVLAEGNLGYAGGVNRCIGHTPDAEAWWILNPDTQPAPDAMALKLERLRRGDCEAVGCTLQLLDGRVQSYGGLWRAWLARAVSIGFGASAEAPADAAAVEKAQNYLNGAAMMVSRRFVEIAGPMREDYFLYGEEVEWCLRAQARGLALGFAAGAVVHHEQGTTTGNEPDIRNRTRLSVYLNERNKVLVTRDLAPYRLPLAAAAALATIFLRYGRRLAWRQLGYGLQGWWSGLRNERGVPAGAQVHSG